MGEDYPISDCRLSIVDWAPPVEIRNPHSAIRNRRSIDNRKSTTDNSRPD